MDLVGNVWLDQILGVFSLTLKELSSISLWRLSVFSSSKGLLLPLRDANTELFFFFTAKKVKEKKKKEGKEATFLSLFFLSL